MHIRLLAIGSRGDVQPYIALALGLKAAGFTVSIGTTANFRAFVESWGLTAVTSDVDMESVVRGRSRRQAKWELFRILLDTTYELSQGADVLVYSGAALFTAPHVAEKLAIPAIPALAQPAIYPTRAFPSVGMPTLALGGWYNRFTYGFVDRLTWTFTKSKVNQWRHDTLGLPPATISPMAMTRSSHLPTLFGFSPSVLPKPAEWGANVHVTGYWFLPRDEQWQPSPELAQFLDAGSPPVYIGFGSMASRDPEQVAKIVLDATRQANVRAVLASGWGGLSATNTPDNVLLVDSAPHDWLFPRMAAVVHHGGAGTTAAGLQASKPTVIVPFGGDQPFWGQHIHALGVGPTPIPHKRLTVDSLAAAIRTAINDDSVRTRAAALGEKIRAEDGVRTAVGVIAEAVKSSK